MDVANLDLFKNLVVPESIDKSALIDNILLRGGEFEVLYADGYFMRDAIGSWSKKWARTFEKWAEVLAMDYNPLDNYDRYEEWEDKRNNTTNANTTSNSVGTSSTVDGRSNNTTTTNSTSAYDSSDFSNRDLAESDTTESGNSSSNTSDDTTTSTTGLTNESNVHTGRVRGNIGVVDTMALVKKQLDVVRFNIIDEITDIFLTEFTLQVY